MSGLRAFARVLLCATLGVIGSALLASSAPAASTSSHVAYVFDFGTGSNDTAGPGFGSSIFVDALTGAPAGGSYTTADASKTVTVTDLPVAAVDVGGVGALTAFDTVILYEICDIASHPNTMNAVNQYLLNGGKVMIFDADRCSGEFGEPPPADYSTFLFPFTASTPGPAGKSGPYTHIEASTLTTGLVLGPQPGDAVGDANTFVTFDNKWCGSITAQNSLGNDGFVESYARTPAGGLAIYEGEDFWFTFGPTAHLREVFDLMLKQDYNPDGLPCALPASGIKLAPPTQSHNVGETATVTATVVDADNNGQPGITVTFSVLSGPDAGQTGSATTDSSGNASFSYVCGAVGTDTVEASFTDSFGGVHHSNDVTVQCTDQPITARGVDISATEGAPFSGVVATFTDPDAAATASEYSATITWGDGFSSPGTITGGGGSFSVTGTHTYAEEGSYPVSVTIVDTDNAANSATTHSTATVGDALLAAAGMSLTSPQSFNGAVATFTDANAGAPASDFTATIDWGDATSSAGTVSGSGGSYTVSGSHTYAGTGFFIVKVHIVDDGGSTADATTTILIFAGSGGGNFVIGDENAAIGTGVTFWGAQWWKLNSLSGGGAPASFKGFEDTPPTTACGTLWSTDPGNSTPPPAGPLPAFMAVIVSSSISKSGSSISGNSVHVVVVKTNVGYAPNPGHAGTGTVVATVC